MSMFMPEGSQNGPQLGVSSITPSNPETTQEDIALMQRVLNAAARNPNLIPTDFMAYVFDYIQTSRLEIPIGQIPGFNQFTLQAATAVATTTTTSSTTPVAGSPDAGPSLDGIPAGRYAFWFGGEGWNTVAANTATMQLFLNGVADVGCTAPGTVPGSSVSRIGLAVFSNPANSVDCRYYSSAAGNSASFADRWLVALRYANL